MADPFYITTAISYPNGKPHIGHAYEAIAADVIARFQRQSGREVRLQTGTDEHGLKMAQKARELGVTPQALCDEMSGYFIEMCKVLNVEYDTFLRTTEPRHHAASQALWQRMAAAGDLYLDRYEGWYSIRDEAFYEEKELSVVEGKGGEGSEKLSPQGTPVEWTVEESWFFRLSKYAEPLLKLYAEHPEFIQPDSRRNEVMRFVEGGLRDLSVSRTSFDWGVKVPGSDDHVMPADGGRHVMPADGGRHVMPADGGRHVMYVWVDALTNYLTGLGFPNENGDMARFWPADLHLIGKDIVRFHAVYWPAFLMSAGLPLPKQVYGHGFVLARDGAKMGKSAGNAADPLVLAEKYGVDALRYFLMREVSFGNDGTWSEEAIVTRCNAELANSFGNLAQRVLSMIFKNLDGKLDLVVAAEADDALCAMVSAACRGELIKAFASLDFSSGIEAWMRAVFACNQYVDDQAPWTLKKTDPERMQAVLLTLFKAVRELAIAIRPVVPASADRLLDQMGIPVDERDFIAMGGADWYPRLVASGFVLSQPVGVFPRLEHPAEEANQ